MYEASIFSSVWHFLTLSPDAIFSLFLIVLGFIVTKFVVPLIKTQLAKSVAQHLLIIADDLTDYYVAKYPNSQAAEWIDKAVDKLIESFGISKETATRIITAAIRRKQRQIKV